MAERFRFLNVTVPAGLFDDPLLLLRTTPTGRSILLDCGRIEHLAKRVVREIDAVFVTHAHMDHFMGFSSLVRQLHVSPRTVAVFGPPGLAARAAATFAGYDWNLTEPHWGSFRVHEIHPDHLETTLFPGPEGFPPRPEGSAPLAGGHVFATRHLAVSSVACDHLIPSLAYRVEERPSFGIDDRAMARQGVLPGGWIEEMRRRFARGALAGPLRVPRLREGEPVEEVRDGNEVWATLGMRRKPAAVGYVTDVGFSRDNEEKLVTLLTGVTVLVCECAFPRSARERARVSGHLCSDDVSRLAAVIRPRYLVPIHLSKTWLGRSREIFAELELPPGTELVALPERLVPAPRVLEAFPRVAG